MTFTQLHLEKFAVLLLLIILHINAAYSILKASWSAGPSLVWWSSVILPRPRLHVISKQHSGWNYSKFTANIYRQFSSFSYSLLKNVSLSVSTFELLLK